MGTRLETRAFFMPDDIRFAGRTTRGRMILKETRTIENLTTCKECLTLTLTVPKDCRLNMDMLSVRLEDLFNREFPPPPPPPPPLEKV